MVGELPGENLKRFKARDGVELCYRISGPADADTAVVLIHGLASNMTRWTEFCKHTGINQSLRLIRIDLRGHGCSQYRGSYSSRDWVEDLHQLQQNEGLKQIIVVGHSMGGQLALHYAHHYPLHTRAIVLVDPIFCEAIAGVLAWVKKLKWGLWLYKGILRLGYRLGIYDHHLEYRDLYALDRGTRQFLKDHPDKTIADLYGSPWKDLYYIPIANYLEDMLLVNSPTPPAEGIKVPVRILRASSPATSSTQVADAIIARFPDHQVKTVEADHWPLTEHPKQSRQVIESFINELK
jgi:pimeloyl-ACP methyl ester carboxylesterase